jgi:hypothetical protein
MYLKKLIYLQKRFKGRDRYFKIGDFMAIAYAKLYELILKKVKDEKEAKEFYDVIIELMKEGKIEVKTEVKEELKDELATKKDLELLEERILRYVDNKFNQIKILIIIVLFAIILTNQNAIEVIKLLFGLK